jgi:hypothetical protein
MISDVDASSDPAVLLMARKVGLLWALIEFSHSVAVSSRTVKATVRVCHLVEHHLMAMHPSCPLQMGFPVDPGAAVRLSSFK